MQMDFGQSGNIAHHHIFDARQGRGRDGDRIAIASETGGHPYYVHLGDIGGSMCDDFRSIHKTDSPSEIENSLT